MTSSTPHRTARGAVVVLLTLLLGAALAGTGLAAGSAAAAAPVRGAGQHAKAGGGGKGSDVVRRGVTLGGVNTTDSISLCPADQRPYPLRGRLVGPRRAVLGYAGATTVQVLVHDAGTGGWFWDLPGHPRYDYATQMARRGQVTLVLDRLGYDRSPLRNGSRTCLEAQATMLHQVVQHLYSGVYRFSKGGGDPVTAANVLTVGHGSGALIAQREAVRFHDVRGLVLMSPLTTSPTALATRTVRRQGQVCAGTQRTFAPFGENTGTFRRLLFASAPADVQRRAASLRNPTPCGDVASLAPTLASVASDRKVTTPVLVLRGARDARATGSVAISSSRKITRRTFRGAGSALVLEKQAPAVRNAVLRWSRGLPPGGRG